MVRLGSIGDVVLTEPVVAALRAARPSCEIGFAVKAALRDLVAGNPDLSTVHALAGGSLGHLAALCREVRARRYSAVVDLHGNARSAAIARAASARLVSVYRKREFADWLRVRVARKPFRATRTTVERYLAALEPLGVRASPARPRFHAVVRDEEWVGNFLAGRGLAAGGFAAVAPGAVWATKRWPAERFGAVMRELFLGSGLPAVLVGSAADRGLCDAAADAAGPSVRTTSAAGEATLGESAAIIGKAALFIGNDSGLSHLSMAAGTPTVAIFGPTDPGQFDFEGHSAVYAGVPCSACSFFGGKRCRLGHWDCMRLIEPDEVLQAALGLLATRGGRGGA